MSVLTENIDEILKSLKAKIEGSEGIRICLEQGSKNFENWVQIELVSILYKKFPIEYQISIEKQENNNIDIIIGQEQDGVEKVIIAIEIKIICLGGAGRTIYLIKNDLNKLGAESNAVERVFLCIVYKAQGKRTFEEGWELGKAHKNGFKGVITEYIENTIKPARLNIVTEPVVDKNDKTVLGCFIF